jgi:hypothetical protein
MDATRKVLALAAVAEIATGAALLIAPSRVGELLIGTALAGPAVIVARVAGLALVSLGLACWPLTPLLGMLTYSVLTTLYLGCKGLDGEATGPLLWPAVGLHVVFSVLLARGAVRRTAAKS